MINYQKILNQKMIDVFIDILTHIKIHGFVENNHLYITFITNDKKVQIPTWLKKKYPDEMTIILQYEFYDLCIGKNDFSVKLSFNGILTELNIPYESIISFADPSANFGLILQKNKVKNFEKKIKEKEAEKNNVINLSKYKKN